MKSLVAKASSSGNTITGKILPAININSSKKTPESFEVNKGKNKGIATAHSRFPIKIPVTTEASFPPNFPAIMPAAEAGGMITHIIAP